MTKPLIVITGASSGISAATAKRDIQPPYTLAVSGHMGAAFVILA